MRSTHVLKTETKQAVAMASIFYILAIIMNTIATCLPSEYDKWLRNGTRFIAYSRPSLGRVSPASTTWADYFDDDVQRMYGASPDPLGPATTSSDDNFPRYLPPQPQSSRPLSPSSEYVIIHSSCIMMQQNIHNNNIETVKQSFIEDKFTNVNNSCHQHRQTPI